MIVLNKVIWINEYIKNKLKWYLRNYVYCYRVGIIELVLY